MTTAALGTVRRLAEGVRTLVAALDGLRSENELLLAERDNLVAAFTMISTCLGGRTQASLPGVSGTATSSARGRREGGSAARSLSRREFDLLCYLLDHAGQVLTHDRLLAAVWSTSVGADRRALRVHINAIRTELDRFDHLPIRIVTLHGIGYRLDHAVDAGAHE